jgi:hypothetical protein
VTYLPDTSIISELVRPAPDAGVVKATAISLEIPATLALVEEP